ncbi:tripartite ATP-independent transporter DctM subunit [Aquamicrobium lusatiense]|jgi:tripartite ATP-independent transporter DctM subunit|uniref:TRAP transporter large permease protein n=1 Tax=Aquamicrobium lusatiense TaxID=89772 RepID=A0A7W9S0N2_9HYPH|nr:TRAP transporter large permease [Aquamicrobium lusatiense]MBB6011932.1 tripartite ATP-independent transporter DctM subunit [Aquamicrobium lusatiense]
MSLSLIVLGALFVLLLFRNVPLIVAIGLPCVVYILMEGLPISLFAQRLFTGIDIFLLLAIPLFAFAGEIMNQATLTDRLVAFAQSLVGRLRGGLAAVNVLSSMFFSGITGSGAADVSATGSLLIPMMKRAGYSAEFSAALTAISAIIGPIIPPSIVLIMYGSLSGTSVASLFMAGIVPGLLMSCAHFAMAVTLSYRRGYPAGEATSIRRIAETGISALPALTVPAIIMGAIVFGITTPTEASALAVLLAIVLGSLVYKTLTWSKLSSSAFRVGSEMADTMLIIGVSNLLAWILAVERVPVILADAVLGITTDPVFVLLLINLILLIVGMFLDTFPALIILTSVLLPLAQSVGVDPIHFGIIISLNLMIGAVTPPVGILLFISTRIARANVLATVKETLPFIGVSLIVQLIVTFTPAISSGVASLID